MTEVGRYGTLLDAIHGVRWPARARVAAGAAGTHSSRQQGLAVEFTAYRPHRQGDDPSHLDWKLLARTDRAYQRISIERSTLLTTLIVDASASMDFPDVGPRKWDRACELTVGLAGVAQSAGDPVGLVVAGAGAGFHPRTRRGVVAHTATVLDLVRPDGVAELAASLRRLPARGRVVVISDFLDGDGDATLAAARDRAAAGVELIAVHMVAVEELQPSGAPFDAVDPERPSERRPLGGSEVVAYQRAFDAWRETVAEQWRALGAAYVEVRTDEPADRAIRRIVRGGG